MLVVFGVLECVLAWPLDLIFPTPWKPVHLVAEVLLICFFLGFALTLARRPHVIEEDHLLLRFGWRGSLTVPVKQIAGVRAEDRSVRGGGLRVDGEEAVCASGSTTSVLLELHSPLTVRVKQEEHQVSRIRLDADEPREAVREIRRTTIPT